MDAEPVFITGSVFSWESLLAVSIIVAAWFVCRRVNVVRYAPAAAPVATGPVRAGDVLSQRGGDAGCDDKVEAGGQYVWILP